MPSSITQRIGALSRADIFPEGTRGSDSGISTGYRLHLRDKPSLAASRPEVDAPDWDGTLMPFSTAPGEIGVSGSLPLGLEFTDCGTILKMPFGTAGYSRVALVTGSLHNFFIPATVATALSAQIQYKYGETTALYERMKYAMVKSLGLAYATGGAAPLDVEMVASGDVAFTDLGVTPTDNGYSGVSVYNGYARMAVAALAPTWLSLAGIKNFRTTIDTGASAESVAFNDGVAGAVNASKFAVRGNLELMKAVGGSLAESDFTFLNNAINRNLMYYNCLWADAAVSGPSTFPTKFLQMDMNGLRFGRQSSTPGGRAGVTTNQPFTLVNDATFGKIAGRAFGTVTGPYLIGAGTNIFSVKINGGATIDVTLTQGAARTAANIVSELNADGTFAAVAVADVFCGKVRVTSKQVSAAGASSSVQFITGTANNCSAVLGFNGTAISGFNTPFLLQAWNGQNSDY